MIKDTLTSTYTAHTFIHFIDCGVIYNSGSQTLICLQMTNKSFEIQIRISISEVGLITLHF